MTAPRAVRVSATGCTLWACRRVNYGRRSGRLPDGYRMDKVTNSLKEKDAAHVVVMADTCHAGYLVTRGLKITPREASIMPAVEEMRSTQSIPDGMGFLAGADTDRKALEISAWSNGAFTHILLQGFNGAADGFEGSGARDGVVTFGEIRSYLASELPAETERILGKAIHPVVAIATGDQSLNELPLSTVR